MEVTERELKKKSIRWLIYPQKQSHEEERFNRSLYAKRIFSFSTDAKLLFR